MAKKMKPKGASRNKGAGGLGGNPNALMAQMQKMQEDMVAAQQELENETIDVSVGGGAINITVTGHQRIESINIDKDAIDLEDEEWLDDLQELLVAAFNQAVEQSQAMATERMESITGGAGGGMPGLDSLLGMG
jgi:nucleoid-associated protein EbfC